MFGSTATQDDSALANAVTIYGALCRRLPAKWHLLRNCTLDVGGELHFVQLVILHRDHGVGLIDLSRDDYTFPDLAIRLTRQILHKNGLAERFPGFLPVVFLSAKPSQARDLPKLIAEAFVTEKAIGIRDPAWADWAFQALQSQAEEARRGESPDDEDERDPERNPAPPRSRRWLMGGAVVSTVLFLLAASGFLVVETMTALSPKPPHPQAIAMAPPPSQPPQDNARMLSESDAARYIGLDLAVFRKRRLLLEQEGFPRPIAATGSYDKSAIDHWIDTAGSHSAGATLSARSKSRASN